MTLSFRDARFLKYFLSRYRARKEKQSTQSDEFGRTREYSGEKMQEKHTIATKREGEREREREKKKNMEQLIKRNILLRSEERCVCSEKRSSFIQLRTKMSFTLANSFASVCMGMNE